MYINKKEGCLMINNKTNPFIEKLTKSVQNIDYFIQNIVFPYTGILYFDEKNEQLVISESSKLNFDITQLFIKESDVKDRTYIDQDDIITYIKKEYIPELFKILLVDQNKHIEKDNVIYESNDTNQMLSFLGQNFSKSCFNMFLSDNLNQLIATNTIGNEYCSFFESKNQTKLENMLIGYFNFEKIEYVQNLDIYMLMIFLDKYSNKMYENCRMIKRNSQWIIDYDLKLNSFVIQNIETIINELKNNDKYQNIYSSMLQVINDLQFNLYTNIFSIFNQNNNLKNILIDKEQFSKEFIAMCNDNFFLFKVCQNQFDFNNSLLLKLLKKSYVKSPIFEYYDQHIVIWTKSYQINEHNQIVAV